MASLKDIAGEAGVSIKTVSKVLNGQVKEIRAETKKRAEKIRKIARKLGYQPNLNARAMRLKKTFQVGILTDTITNPTSSEVAETLTELLTEKGYQVLLSINKNNFNAYSCLEKFGNGMVDGVINVDPLVDARIMEKYLGALPAIIWNRDSAISASVQDYAMDMKNAVKYLFGLGHKKIGLISGNVKVDSRNNRIRYFRESMLSFGLENDEKQIKISDSWETIDIADQLKDLLEINCTAIIGGNDILAAAAVHELNAMHIKVPKELSVIGFDDSLAAKLCTPSLTTMRRPIRKLSENAVDSLLRIINEQPAKEFETVQSELVVRGTTAKAK